MRWPRPWERRFQPRRRKEQESGAASRGEDRTRGFSLGVEELVAITLNWLGFRIHYHSARPYKAGRIPSSVRLRGMELSGTGGKRSIPASSARTRKRSDNRELAFASSVR